MGHVIRIMRIQQSDKVRASGIFTDSFPSFLVSSFKHPHTHSLIMTSSPAPGSRLVDYFFIAGIKDHQILSTYHSTRDGRQDDELYYHRQQIAIQPNNNSRPPNNLQRDGSFGVLDHVQAVIDHFDKERDHARNTVIAVHDQECLAEKYNMAGGGPGGRHRSASANESSRKRKQFILFFLLSINLVCI